VFHYLGRYPTEIIQHVFTLSSVALLNIRKHACSEQNVSHEKQAVKQALVLTERDMKRVLQHVARARFPNRSHCLLMMSWLAGMRVAEIAALVLTDALAPDGTIRTEIQLSPAKTKGSSARTVLIGSRLKSELEAYVKSLPPNLTLPPKNVSQG